MLVACLQTADQGSMVANRHLVEAKIRQAASQGAGIVLPPELFEFPYFCQSEDPKWFKLACEVGAHEGIKAYRRLAAELGVVIPYSFFERSGQAYFNSIAIIDADGSVLGVYRKSHIPDGPGYEEKFYFNPGDTGFRTWNTLRGRIGVGICWDQWFPEAARAMTLMGADILFYPTAIGSEPVEPGIDSMRHWQRVMQGHAGANMVPVVAANRYGKEKGNDTEVEFYGSSFITDGFGEILCSAERSGDAILTASFQVEELTENRANWGFFRDRRPDLYAPLLTLDGKGQA